MNEHSYDADENESASDSSESGRGMALSLFKGLDAKPLLHNFDGPPLQMYRLTAKATGPDCKTALELGDQPIELKYWYVHEVSLLNRETGEMGSAIRVVLIDDAGQAYAFVSGGIFQSLRNLVDCLGKGPYNPPVKVKVSVHKTGSKRVMYRLQPVD